MKLTAIIPTRGDCDCSPITKHLRSYPEIGRIFVVASDTAFSRYVLASMLPCFHPFEREPIYTQDDDCVTDIRPIIEACKMGDEREKIYNAMTPEHANLYPGAQTLLGFGAIFYPALVNKTFRGWDIEDPLFLRESDRIFATVNPHVTVFPKIEILPRASDPSRLWLQPDHLTARAEINRQILEKTGIEAGCL